MKSCLLLLGFLAFAAGKLPFSNERIVGGSQAEFGDYPWMASLQRDGFGHFCGASIIDEYWILTAAHCVDGGAPSRIVLAEYDILNDEGREEIYYPESVFIHEDYFIFNAYEGAPVNDVALLKLTSPIQYNEYIQPIPLPEYQQQSTGMAMLSGWGADSMSGPPQQYLQELEYPIVTDSHCRDYYYAYTIPPSSLCAGYLESGISACPGDSGSPLLCFDESSSLYQCGVTSWIVNAECGSTDYPNVYAEVSYFVEWAKETMRNN